MSCPCGSDRPFDDCCGPFLRGDARPPTAEALMRARYTAYATGEIDFVFDTQASGGDVDREATEAWSRESKWLGLEVCKVERGGPDDAEGEVEFIARYENGGEEHQHHERASFEKKGGVWKLVDGRLVDSTFRRTQPKIGPNQPCPCGSGKKYKKCCGKP